MKRKKKSPSTFDSSLKDLLNFLAKLENDRTDIPTEKEPLIWFDYTKDALNDVDIDIKYDVECIKKWITTAQKIKAFRFADAILCAQIIEI